MQVAYVTVPITVITVFVPGGAMEEWTSGIIVWDLIALLLLPAALISLRVHTSEFRTLILCSVLGLTLCGVWSAMCYLISRFFLNGEFVGDNPPFLGLTPLFQPEITRLIVGCCFLAVGTIFGAIIAMMFKRKENTRNGIRTTP